MDEQQGADLPRRPLAIMGCDRGGVVSPGDPCAGWLRSSTRSQAPRPPHRGCLSTARRGPVSRGSVPGSALAVNHG